MIYTRTIQRVMVETDNTNQTLFVSFTMNYFLKHADCYRAYH